MDIKLCYNISMEKILIADDSQSWLKHHQVAVRQIFGDDINITLASSATEANEKLYLNSNAPFDIILTDMQMETDYAPLYAGEWLIEQVQKIPAYKNTNIIIVSATPTIRFIAEKYNVEYIPKYNCNDINNYKKVLI